jgi:YVTN family beta-propeller protein
MKTNSIHWGLLALLLLCGGALCFEPAFTAPAQASNTPWGKVVATLPEGNFAAVVINPKTNAVYTVSGDGTEILVLDGKTNQVTATIPNPSGATPEWFDPSQDRLYAGGVETSGNGIVTVIDAKTNSVINTITLVQPQGSVPNVTFYAVNSATGKLYGGYDLESPKIGPGLLAVWDLATGALIETISIDFPQSVAINPKTNRLYVADNFSSQLVVVDGVTNAVIDRIQIGQAYFPDGCYVFGPCITQASAPWGLSLSEKTNRIYVNDVQDGTLYVIDGKTDRIISGPIAVGQGAAGNALDDVSDVLYIINEETSAASALDVKTMKPLGAPVSAGTPASPLGCVFSPSGNCTEYGSLPGSITVNPANNKIYVPTTLSNSPFILVVQGK